jgi:hypothetical protein
MANWALRCKNCGRYFEYSKIPDTLLNFYLPEKPPLPDAGQERACPHCKETVMYSRSDLVFRTEDLRTRFGQ